MVEAKIFIRAKKDALKGLKKVLKKRGRIQRSRIVVDDYIWSLLEKEHFFHRLTKRLQITVQGKKAMPLT